MMIANREVGDGDFPRIGKSSAGPRGNLNSLGVASAEGFDIEQAGGGGINQKSHLGRPDKNFDDRKAVTPFDADFVRLCAKRSGEHRMRHRKEAHDEDSRVHLTNYTPLDASTGSQVTSR